jgi:hypothetical protein
MIFRDSCNPSLGFYGNDSPLALIEHVADKMTSEFPDLEAIILNGDFVRHDIALPDQSGDKEAVWAYIKEAMTTGLDVLRTKTKGKVDILPSIGNNDVIVHNQVPCTPEEATRYYSELFEVWFPPNHTPRGFKRNATRDSFLQGGYYIHDFEGTKQSLIALNTMYFKADNICSLDQGLR